ncbi:MAG: hypothetical protein VR72_00870 [Clostridiaceae bacterium BRH_c20a]|nr:MAG: hypothetical protein VR72_00870 [Clostridiaceae bacterium BRH_c20a]
MKKIAIVAITEKGLLLGDKIYNLTLKAERFSITKLTRKGWNSQYNTLSELMADIFPKFQGFILVMAAGIAVRVIAPFIQDKVQDPAVVVMDENNTFAISLLAGHLGGANKLAEEIAGLTGSSPVITTATDINNMKAIDALAGEWGMDIEPVKNIKPFNKALLNGAYYTFYVEQEMDLPNKALDIKPIANFQGLHSRWNVLVTPKIMNCFAENIIFLRPRNLALGIGCRKNYPREKLLTIVDDFLNEQKLSSKSLATIATIDLKSNEGALIALQTKLKIPLITYSKDELNRCIEGNGEVFSSSQFVKQTVGAACVCEPAALLAVEKGKILVKKTIYEGVTLAVAVKEPFFVPEKNNLWFNME